MGDVRQKQKGTTIDFQARLEKNADVDPIFKDTSVPPGSDPFEIAQPIDLGLANEAQPIETTGPIEVTVSSQDLTPTPSESSTENPTSDDLPEPNLGNEDLLNTHRKLAAAESLFQLINKNCSFSELIHAILNIAMTQIKSEAGSILEINYETEQMFFRAVQGRGAETLYDVKIPMGQGIVGFVCNHQQSLSLTYVDESRIYLKSISASVGFEAKNLTAHPIIIRGVSFGCIELLNRLGEERFTESDKEVLTFICDCASRIIENRLVLSAYGKEQNADKEKVAA